MKNIVIAAGYATRLYPLTKDFPKPLLKVGNKSILERMLDDIDLISEVDSHIIVTNHRFAKMFEKWVKEMKYTKPIYIIDDGTESNESRLGAVRDLLLAIDIFDIEDDIMVVAADNVLGFSMSGFVQFFKGKNASVIMCHKEDNLRHLQKTGVASVENDMRVMYIQEKPNEPVSNWAVPPFYIYSKNDIPMIKDCLKNGCSADAPGNLANYVSENSMVYAWEMPGMRYDIGSMESYKEAQEKFG